MERQVPLEQRGCILPAEEAQGLVEGLDGGLGVEIFKSGPESAFEDHLIQAGALLVDRVRIEVVAIDDFVAQVGEPGQGGLFEIELAGEGGHRRAPAEDQRAAEASFSASLMRISPGISLGRSVSRSSARVRDSARADAMYAFSA